MRVLGETVEVRAGYEAGRGCPGDTGNTTTPVPTTGMELTVAMFPLRRRRIEALFVQLTSDRARARSARH